MVEFSSEVERRVAAVRMVRGEGMSVSDAAAAVGRSRQWLSKWLARDRAGEDLTDRSRASPTSYRPLPSGLAELVLEYRDRLEGDPVASVGGLAILAAMERNGVSPLPSIRSIERILTSGGRTRPRTKKPSRSTVPVLPLPSVGYQPGVWQQADWVQDRYLEGGVRYNSIQTVDMGSRGGIARPYLHRSMLNVVEFMCEHAWPRLSIPRAVSVDNAFSKTSHIHNPWTGFVRLCLFFGVEAVVSPPRELGWTNGVEGFNNLWQDRTIVHTRYPDLDAVVEDTSRFNRWALHDRPICDPTIAGTRYPAEVIDRQRSTLRWPPKLFIADHLNAKNTMHIPLTTGRVTFIRRVSNQHIRIAHHSWRIDLPDHALVVASITTGDKTLTLRHQAETHATYDYPIISRINDSYYPPHPTTIYHHA